MKVKRPRWHGLAESAPARLRGPRLNRLLAYFAHFFSNQHHAPAARMGLSANEPSDGLPLGFPVAPCDRLFREPMAFQTVPSLFCFFLFLLAAGADLADANDPRKAGAPTADLRIGEDACGAPRF